MKTHSGIFLALIFILLNVFSIQSFADAQAEIDAAMISDSDVRVFQKKNWIGVSRFFGFEPTSPLSNKGLIIYPGAFVDPKAYAPIARHFADLGYRSAVVTPPFNFGFLGVQYATYVKRYWGSAVDNYVIAGHSLGGTVAAMYADSNDRPSEKVGALVLLASYPTPIIDDLSEKDLLVTSIWGSEDGLTSESDINNSMSQLPPNTSYVEIVGGNHTQFYYSDGLQANDNPAFISLEAQQAIVELEIEVLLNSI